MKVVINSCFGGFSISKAAAQHMAHAGCPRAKAEVAEHDAELVAFADYRDKGIQPPDNERGFRTSIWDINIKYNKQPDFHGYGYVEGMDGGYERNSPFLVAAVEALGKEASGKHANLLVVEIPDDVKWHIHEYDGREHVAEDHQTWP